MAKIGIVEEEADESAGWLEMIIEAEPGPAHFRLEAIDFGSTWIAGTRLRRKCGAMPRSVWR